MRCLRCVLAIVLALLAAELPAAATPLSEKEQSQAIEGLFVQLRELYIDSGADRKTIEAGIRAQLKKGAYRNLDGAAFARALEADLRRVGRDPHFRFDYFAGQLPPLPTSWEPPKEQREALRAMFALGNNGFTSTSRLEGNVGYIDIDSIPDTGFIAETAAAALTFVKHTDALILDLRRARGGEPRGVAYLLSYFLGEHVHTFDTVTRNEKTTHFTETVLPGPRYGADKPIFVLIGKDTFSGGEALAYCLQAAKRARMVGERTRGGSTATMPVKVSEHFTAGIPAMATVSAVTGGNWNNVGVTPDVEAPAESAQNAAYRLALENVLSKERDPVRRDRLRTKLKTLPEVAESSSRP